MVSETCRSTITSDAFFVTTNQGDETIDHILVGYPESRQLWWFILKVIRRPDMLPTVQGSFLTWWCHNIQKEDQQKERTAHGGSIRSSPSPLEAFGRNGTTESSTTRLDPRPRWQGDSDQQQFMSLDANRMVQITCCTAHCTVAKIIQPLLLQRSI